jgi:hypothetical protein
MNAARATAYSRVMRIIEELGPAKLQPAESELIREAADALLFTGDELSDAAQTALAEAEALVAHLEASGRWTGPRADELFAAIAGCGPAVPAELPDAA